MSAIIIYPAAFRGEVSSSTVTHGQPPQESTLKANAPVIPLVVPRRGGDRPATNVQAIQTVRVSAADSARSLATVQGHLAAVRAGQREITEQAQAVSQVSEDLGQQMKRLIAETRRMVAYLRADL